MSREARLEKARLLVGEFPLPALCRVLSVSPTSLRRSSRPRRDLTNLASVVQVQLLEFAGYGVRRMHHHLRRIGVDCTREELARVYASLGVFFVRPKRVEPKKTNSKGVGRYPDLARGLALERPNQLWVADVTHVPVGTGWGYLALVTDAYTRRIVGWEISLRPTGALTLSALEKALRAGRPEIHHSDGDTIYAAKAYVARLREVGSAVSMAPPARPQDNGKAERLNRTVKDEEVRRGEYRNLEEARTSLERFIRRYNERRIHQALRYKTPEEVYQEWIRDQAEEDTLS